MKLTGWSLAEIDAAPAARLDWLLAIDKTVNDVIADKNRAASERAT